MKTCTTLYAVKNAFIRVSPLNCSQYILKRNSLMYCNDKFPKSTNIKRPPKMTDITNLKSNICTN